MSDRFIQTSGKDNWRSPRWVVTLAAELINVSNFDLDAAALENSRICERYYGPDHSNPRMRNALELTWPPVAIFCNPPYSKKGGGLRKWCERFVHASRNGATVVALFFARTDTSAWHDYVTQASEVHLFRGRLRFLDPETGIPSSNSAPAPSCLVIWRPNEKGPPAYHYVDSRGMRQA